MQATTTGAGSTYTQQRIEGINSRALNGRTVTCSATVFQNTGAALNAQITLGKPTTTLDTFAAQTILSVSGNFSIPTGVPTKISWTYTLGAAEATLGLLAQFGFSAIGAVTSKDFWVGDLQLEAGSLVTPFETRPIGVELALCQRYLLAIPANQFYGSGSMGASGAGSYFFIPTPVCMRVAPSKSGATDVHWVAAGSVLTFGAMSVTTNGLSFVGTHAAVASSGMAGVIYSSGIANYFSAEL